jgi:hypothetical protein
MTPCAAGCSSSWSSCCPCVAGWVMPWRGRCCSNKYWPRGTSRPRSQSRWLATIATTMARTPRRRKTRRFQRAIAPPAPAARCALPSRSPASTTLALAPCHHPAPEATQPACTSAEPALAFAAPKLTSKPEVRPRHPSRVGAGPHSVLEIAMKSIRIASCWPSCPVGVAEVADPATPVPHPHYRSAPPRAASPN